jgi:hypothetical protein
MIQTFAPRGSATKPIESSHFGDGTCRTKRLTNRYITKCEYCHAAARPVSAHENDVDDRVFFDVLDVGGDDDA